jgi:hypothetical protein
MMKVLLLAAVFGFGWGQNDPSGDMEANGGYHYFGTLIGGACLTEPTGIVCCHDYQGVYCGWPPTDVAPMGIYLYSYSAGPLSTGGNQAGSDLTISGGLGIRTAAMTAANCGAPDTITATIDGADTVATLDTTFACGGTDAACATELETWLDTLTGIDSCTVPNCSATPGGLTPGNFTAVSGTVYAWRSTAGTFTLSTDDATCAALTNGTDGGVIIGGDSPTMSTLVGSLTIAPVDDLLCTPAGGDTVITGTVRVTSTSDLEGYVSIGNDLALDANKTCQIARTLTGTTGADLVQLDIDGDFTEFTSGTHGLIAGLRVQAPTVTDGAGTEAVTNLATVYVEGAPTAGTTPANGPYALFVDGGNLRTDGDLFLDAATGQHLTFIVDNDAATPVVTLEPGTGFYASANNAAALSVGTTAQWVQTNGVLTFQVATDIAGSSTIDISPTGNLSLTPSLDVDINPTGGDTVITGTVKSTGTADFESYASIGNALSLSAADTVRIARNFNSGTIASQVYLAGTITATSGTSNIQGLRVEPIVTINSGGVHPVVASATISEPSITLSSGTVTDAATLRIVDAPTEGSTGNYALWVDSGATQLDGSLDVEGVATMSGNLDVEDYMIVGGASSLNSDYTLVVDRDFTTAGNSRQLLVQGDQVTSGGTNNCIAAQVNPSMRIASAQVHPNLASLVVDEPAITITTGSCTVGSSIWVQAAPTECGSNYALFVDDGAAQLDGSLDVEGVATMSGNLDVEDYAAIGDGSAPTATATLIVDRDFTSSTTANQLDVTGTATVDGGTNDLWTAHFRPSGTTINSGGVHPIVATVAIEEPIITETSGSCTAGASLYVKDAPTECGSLNYAAWFDSGDVRIDGALTVGGMTMAGDLDMDGYDILMDQDGDTGFINDRDAGVADDEIDVQINSAVDFTFSANAFTAVTGSSFSSPTYTGAGAVQITTGGTTDLTLDSTQNTVLKDPTDIEGYASIGNDAALDANKTLQVGRTLTGTTGADLVQLDIDGDFTEFTSGTHALIAGLRVQAPTVTDGGGTEAVTGLATLYVDAAPTAGSTPTSGPYAAWFDAGDVRADGDILLDAATGQHLALGVDNDAVTPSLTLESGTGFYAPSNNNISIAHNGVETWQMSGTTFTGVATNGPRMLDETASGTNPVWSISGDADTGIGWNGADELSLIAGATEMIRLDEDTTNVIYLYAQTDLEGNDLVVDADGDSTISETGDDVIAVYLGATGGTGYLEIINANNGGHVAVGRTTATEPSMVSITDGGADNEAGELVLYDDGGTGHFFWVSTADVFRAHNTEPADDDAAGYAIMDLSDGTIGASTQAVTCANLTTAGLHIATPTSQELSAAETLTLTSAEAELYSDGGAVVSTADPAITNGTANGETVCLMGTSDANRIEFKDEADNPGSTLELAGNVAFDMGLGDRLCLRWYATGSKWYETSRSNN